MEVKNKECLVAIRSKANPLDYLNHIIAFKYKCWGLGYAVTVEGGENLDEFLKQIKR